MVHPSIAIDLEIMRKTKHKLFNTFLIMHFIYRAFQGTQWCFARDKNDKCNTIKPITVLKELEFWGRILCMEGLVHEEKLFERHPLWDWEPVKLLKDSGDVVMIADMQPSSGCTGVYI